MHQLFSVQPKSCTIPHALVFVEQFDGTHTLRIIRKSIAYSASHRFWNLSIEWFHSFDFHERFEYADYHLTSRFVCMFILFSSIESGDRPSGIEHYYPAMYSNRPIFNHPPLSQHYNHWDLFGFVSYTWILHENNFVYTCKSCEMQTTLSALWISLCKFLLRGNDINTAESLSNLRRYGKLKVMSMTLGTANICCNMILSQQQNCLYLIFQSIVVHLKDNQIFFFLNDKRKNDNVKALRIAKVYSD